MSSTVPPNFLDLNTATSRLNQNVNAMGVVTDVMAPRRSNGRDWMFTFSITDLTYDTYGACDEGLKVRFFRPMESELPAIKGTGDVISIRGLGIKNWSGMTMGLSNRTTTWVVFPAASIPINWSTSPLQLKHVKEGRASVPTYAEMKYAFDLCNSRERNTFTDPLPTPQSSSVAPSPSGTTSTSKVWRDKFSLIKDMQVDTFHDIVGQVVKIYSHNDRTELYLTDYTSNPLLWNYSWGQDDGEQPSREGDEFNYAPRNSNASVWPGPFGKMTLTVTLWPPHTYFANQNIKVNEFVHLRNTRIKWSKDAKLEGVLHSDRRYPDRIDVTPLKNNEDDDRVKDVLRRKRDYAQKFEKQSAGFVAEARGLKRKELEETKPLSKTAQKKKRKLEREKLAKAKREGLDSEEDKENKDTAATNSGPTKVLPQVKPSKEDPNKNVKCANHLIAPRPLSAILSLHKHTNTTPEGASYTLPFQNIKSRATVRVVDYFPNNLADFAVRLPKASEYDILSDLGNSQDESESEQQTSDTGSDDGEDSQWQWRFALVLEDATGPKTVEKATITVFVAGQDAECLLKLDAENLHKSPRALAEVRERLFLLWGDLEERKSREVTVLKDIDTDAISRKKDDAPKSKAFQCCLKEYGVKIRVQRNGVEEDSEDDEDHANENWAWERRWRLFGTTIV